jgi:hypothetical protein
MWVFSDVGFFSIVRKPEDEDEGMVTIRARVRSDLERLKEFYLPTLGDIVEGKGTDYPYRARSTQSDFAEALRQIGQNVGYTNFKNEVGAKQGHPRAHVYSDVWRTLLRLEDQE